MTGFTLGLDFPVALEVQRPPSAQGFLEERDGIVAGTDEAVGEVTDDTFFDEVTVECSEGAGARDTDESAVIGEGRTTAVAVVDHGLGLVVVVRWPISVEARVNSFGCGDGAASATWIAEHEEILAK